MGFEFLAPFDQYPTPVREERIFLRLKREVLDYDQVVVDTPLRWKSIEFTAVEGYCFQLKPAHSQECENRYYCRIYPGVNSFVYLCNDFYHRKGGPSTLYLNRENRKYQWHIHGRKMTLSQYLQRFDLDTQKELVCKFG